MAIPCLIVPFGWSRRHTLRPFEWAQLNAPRHKPPQPLYQAVSLHNRASFSPQLTRDRAGLARHGHTWRGDRYRRQRRNGSCQRWSTWRWCDSTAQSWPRSGRKLQLPLTMGALNCLIGRNRYFPRRRHRRDASGRVYEIYHMKRPAIWSLVGNLPVQVSVWRRRKVGWCRVTPYRFFP